MPSFQTMQTNYDNGRHSYVEVSTFDRPMYVAISEDERARLAMATLRGREHSLDPDKSARRSPEESQKESLRRTRKQIKALTLLNADNSWRFLTLTYEGAGCHDRRQIARDIQHMVERMEAHYRRDVRYICVYEYHHTGHGLHAHLLIDAPYETNEAFRRMFWRRGFVKIIRLKKQSQDSSLMAVLKYLIKYISKDVKSDVSGLKRYSSSRNLKTEPHKSYHKDPQGHVMAYLVGRLKATGFREVDTWRVQIGDIEMMRTILIREGTPSGADSDAPGDEW